MSSTSDQPFQPSLFTTLAVSIGALSGGFATGVWYQFRKANFKFDFRKHQSDVKFAASALGAGTILCFGTFGFLGSLFVVTTGVTSFKELGYFFRSIVKGEKVDGPTQSQLEYKRITANMTLEEEMTYWYNYYVSPENEENSTNKIDSASVDTSSLLTPVNEEELLEWEKNNNNSVKSNDK